MVETEVKIRIKDIHSISKKVQDQGAVLEKDRFFEENTLYDFPSQALYKKRQALRVRRINRKVFLAFKGAPQRSRKYKIRSEYETEVKNEKQLKKILKALGLMPAFQYQKHRTVYRKKRLKICVDETQAGNFIELEGKREDIARMAERLGFNKKQFIKLDYIQLMKRKDKA
ncbi:MAG: class IV adenylate cyclase [Candidatus Aminicenantes bacterium]